MNKNNAQVPSRLWRKELRNPLRGKWANNWKFTNQSSSSSSSNDWQLETRDSYLTELLHLNPWFCVFSQYKHLFSIFTNLSLTDLTLKYSRMRLTHCLVYVGSYMTRIDKLHPYLWKYHLLGKKKTLYPSSPSSTSIRNIIYRTKF